jgi:hypothetical protein
MPVTGRVTYTDTDFYSLPVFKQKAIILAGPAINILSGIVLLPVFPLFGILSITVGCSNLIPAKTSAGISDGGFIFTGKYKWPATIFITAVVIFLVIVISLTRAINPGFFLKDIYNNPRSASLKRYLHLCQFSLPYLKTYLLRRQQRGNFLLHDLQLLPYVELIVL